MEKEKIMYNNQEYILIEKYNQLLDKYENLRRIENFSQSEIKRLKKK